MHSEDTDQDKFATLSNLWGSCALGAADAVRFFVLEVGSVKVDESGAKGHFESVLRSEPNLTEPIVFEHDIAASLVPNNSKFILGVKGGVAMYANSGNCLRVGLQTERGDRAFLHRGTTFTIYCEPGPNPEGTRRAFRTLALTRWTMLGGRQQEVPITPGYGSPFEVAGPANLLASIESIYQDRFIRVGPLPEDVAVGDEPAFEIDIGSPFASALDDNLKGLLHVNHALAWNFIRIVKRQRWDVARNGHPFPMTAEYCPSSPIGMPLVLQLTPTGGGPIYRDKWIFPLVDPALWVTTVQDSESPRFNIQFDAGECLSTSQQVDWTVEYLVRQKWVGAKLLHGCRSAPPRSGLNLSFKVVAVQPDGVSVAPRTIMQLRAGRMHITSRADLARAFAAECPTEIAERMVGGSILEIRAELRPSMHTRWIPTGVIVCAVRASDQELKELQNLANRLATRLSNAATLGCQVNIDLINASSEPSRPEL